MRYRTIGLALAFGLVGCQGSHGGHPPGGGGGKGPTVAPSPLKAPAHPQLKSGPTGGVGQRARGDMGGMDSSGIGPGSAAGGGGHPQVVPKGGQAAGENSNVAPRNDPTRIKR